MLEVRTLGLSGVLEITPRRFGDSRGFFSETYNAERFREAGIDLTFVQDNHSHSVNRGVLRGLHYQLLPCAQDKLVSVVRGAILDIAVDIRKGSTTFAKWISLEVSAEKGNQVLIPKGFAHGFVTLADHTDVVYKVTDRYSPEHDRSIRYDDPDIGIDWPTFPDGFELSHRDRAAPSLRDSQIFE